MKPLVYLVIVNYNGTKDTEECLISLKNLSYPNYKVVVVDNASSDKSIIQLQSKFPKYHFIFSNENTGFTGGNNIGIKYAIKNQAQFITLINNDTVIEDDFLTPLVDEMIKDENIGICGGKINYYSTPNLIWFAGGEVNKNNGKCKHYLINEFDREECCRYVDYISGCLLMIRKQVIDEIGLLDDDYFLYCEEVDWCLRARKNGWHIKYNPSSKILHKVSQSTSTGALHDYYLLRNRFLLIKKNSNTLKNKILCLISIWMTSIKLIYEGWVTKKYDKIKMVFLANKHILFKKYGKL